LKQTPEKYYFVFECWSLDPNQWSMLIDGIAVLLAISGVVIAYILYEKQRKDNSKDAFDFFQSSLPELKKSIVNATVDLKEFQECLDLDNFISPVLSASLNDKFLQKINLIHLNRFYRINRKNKLKDFKDFLIDTNFFGDYQSYISKEINYLQTNYLENKNDYSKWQLLRSTDIFSTSGNDDQNLDYRNFYTNWVRDLNQDDSVFHFNEQGEPAKLKSKEQLIKHIKDLIRKSEPYIPVSERASNVHFLASKVVSAYIHISNMQVKIKNVIEKDIAKFESVLINLNNLLEKQDNK